MTTSMTLAPLGPLARFMLTSLLCSAAACAPGRFSVDGACVAKAKAICHFQYSCCNATERRDAFDTSKLPPYDDESSCVDVYTRALCEGDDRQIGSVDAERAAWDDARAEACYKPLYDALDACDAPTVFLFDERSATCKAIITGKVPDNGVCFEAYECATEGAICLLKDNPTPMIPLITSEGTCVPPAGLGESCSIKMCVAGLYCDLVTQNCAAKKATGQMCMVDAECQSDKCDPVAGMCIDMADTKPVYDICLGKNK